MGGAFSNGYRYTGEIAAMLPVKDVLVRYGVPFNGQGFARCPFHHDRTASMRIMPDGRRAHCFGCGITVDAIDVAQKLFGDSFKCAVERLNDDFGLGLPIKGNLSYKARSALNAKITLMRAQRRALDEQIAVSESAYLTAYAQWLENERVFYAHAPSTPDAEWDDDFVHAAHQRATLEDAMDRAEYVYMQALQSRRLHGWTKADDTGMDAGGLRDAGTV